MQLNWVMSSKNYVLQCMCENSYILTHTHKKKTNFLAGEARPWGLFTSSIAN